MFYDKKQVHLTHRILYMPQVQLIRDKKSRICAGFLYVIVLKNAVSRLIMILFFMENRNRGKISSYFYIFVSMKKARNPLWDRAFCLKYLLRGLYMAVMVLKDAINIVAIKQGKPF